MARRDDDNGLARGYYGTKDTEMAAFDRADPKLREILRDAPVPVNALALEESGRDHLARGIPVTVEDVRLGIEALMRNEGIAWPPPLVPKYRRRRRR